MKKKQGILRSRQSFLARNPTCDLFAVGESVFVCLCGVVFLSRSPRLSVFVLVLSLLHSLSQFPGQGWAAMVTKRREGLRGFWVRNVRRKVLADAITIDGRKEWICKFCSEPNVWTRFRCIPVKIQAGDSGENG